MMAHAVVVYMSGSFCDVDASSDRRSPFEVDGQSTMDRKGRALHSRGRISVGARLKDGARTV
jgi:hypothetical protein